MILQLYMTRGFTWLSCSGGFKNLGFFIILRMLRKREGEEGTELLFTRLEDFRVQHRMNNHLKQKHSYFFWLFFFISFLSRQLNVLIAATSFSIVFVALFQIAAIKIFQYFFPNTGERLEKSQFIQNHLNLAKPNSLTRGEMRKGHWNTLYSELFFSASKEQKQSK